MFFVRIRVVPITIIGFLIFAFVVFIIIISVLFYLTVKSFIRMLAIFFLAAFRAICHRAGGIQNQHRRSFAGALLGLLQDDLQRDFIRIIGCSGSSFGNFLDAIRQILSKLTLYPFFIAIIIAIFDVTCTCSGSLPHSSQRDGREQADGQDQRQQQGYDSFHHFFFSPYVWFNFFVFFFRFSMCNGRGAGV